MEPITVDVDVPCLFISNVTVDKDEKQQHTTVAILRGQIIFSSIVHEDSTIMAEAFTTIQT